MTDEQIIKALECCIKSVSLNDCEDLQCPACDEIGCFFMRKSTEYYPESLIQEMGKAVLEVLKQKDAEIEGLARLKVKLHKKYLEQKAEIERLTKQIDGLRKQVYDLCGGIVDLKDDLKTAKSEAYKEVAEKHREIIMAFRDDDDQISLKVCEYDANTDNILKELTEGGNEDGMDKC